MVSKKIDRKTDRNLASYVKALFQYVSNPEIALDPDDREKKEEKCVAMLFNNFSFCGNPAGRKVKPDEMVDMSRKAEEETMDYARLCPTVVAGVSQPIVHRILSFQNGERPSEEECFAIAREFMEDLGYAEDHQWVAAIHNDTDNLHLHIVSSRVSILEPKKLMEEGRRWWKRESRKACARLEKKFGLNPEPESSVIATDDMELVTRVNPFTGVSVTRERIKVVEKPENDENNKKSRVHEKVKRMEQKTGLKSARTYIQEIMAGLEQELKPGARFGDIYRMLAMSGIEAQVVEQESGKRLIYSLDGKIWHQPGDVNPKFSKANLEKALGASFRKPNPKRLAGELSRARARLADDALAQMTAEANVEIPAPRAEVRELWDNFKKEKIGKSALPKPDKKFAAFCGRAKNNFITPFSLDYQKRLDERICMANVPARHIPAAREALVQFDILDGQVRKYIRFQIFSAGNPLASTHGWNRFDILEAIPRLAGLSRLSALPLYGADGQIITVIPTDDLIRTFRPTIELNAREGMVAGYFIRDFSSDMRNLILKDLSENFGAKPVAALPLAGFGGVTFVAASHEPDFEDYIKGLRGKITELPVWRRQPCKRLENIKMTRWDQEQRLKAARRSSSFFPEDVMCAPSFETMSFLYPSESEKEKR